MELEGKQLGGSQGYRNWEQISPKKALFYSVSEYVGDTVNHHTGGDFAVVLVITASDIQGLGLRSNPHRADNTGGGGLVRGLH